MAKYIASNVNELTAALDWYADHLEFFAGSSIGEVFCRQMEQAKIALAKEIEKEAVAHQ